MSDPSAAPGSAPAEPACAPQAPVVQDRPLTASPALQARIDWTLLLPDLPLDAALRQALLSMVSLRTFRPGAAIHRHGQPATVLRAVCEGSVGLGRRSRGGADPLMQSFQLKRTVRSPAWLDLHTAWLGTTYELDACATGPAPTLVLEWPVAVARGWLRHQPEVLAALMRALAAQMCEVQDQLHELSSKDALGRVAAWLMRRAGPNTRLEIVEKKRDVASQLAISPETFSRILRQLARRRLVSVDGYQVALLDRIGLMRLARDF